MLVVTKKNKQLTAQEILNLYDGARNGHNFKESENTEEVS